MPISKARFMDLQDYDYQLPAELIAQHAVQPKSYSRMLVVEGDELYNNRCYQLIDYLRPGDVLVMNESRVLKNKLMGNKITGAAAELIMMDPLDTYR